MIIRPERRASNGERHESDEGDWRNAPDRGYAMLDELSREDILLAVASLT